MALATYCFLNAWLHYNSTVAGITHSSDSSTSLSNVWKSLRNYARNHKLTVIEKWCQKLLLSNSWLEKTLQDIMHPAAVMDILI